MKVKIFRSKRESELEEAINDWLESNDKLTNFTFHFTSSVLYEERQLSVVHYFTVLVQYDFE